MSEFPEYMQEADQVAWPRSDAELQWFFDRAEFHQVVETAPQGTPLTNKDAELFAESLAALELQRQLGSPQGERQPPAASTRVLCLLHASLPQQTGGYAMRAHGVLSTLSRSWDIHCATRPGFPDGATLGDACEEIDGIAYRRLSQVIYPRKHGEMRYMLACVARYEELMRDVRPAVVHLRSTYLVALPGLLAAHRLGIPTVYEVSGLWELVYAGRLSQSGMKGRERRTVWLESLVSRGVDRSVTLTTRMREILVERGVEPSTVLISPNAVEASDFIPGTEREAVIKEYNLDPRLPTIGYLGTFVDYEGLDVLVDSFEILMAEEVGFQAVLVGDGAEYDLIQKRVTMAGLSDHVLITGRKPHNEVMKIYSAIDICAFPRRSTPATEAVSPLKPFEALASSKAVIVSPVSALKDIIRDGFNGLVMQEYTARELARVLKLLITQPELRTALGERGRQWVTSEHSWERSVEPLDRWYSELADSGTGSTTGVGGRDD